MTASAPGAVLPNEVSIGSLVEQFATPTMRADFGTTIGLPRLVCAGVATIVEGTSKMAETVLFTRPITWAAGDTVTVAAWDISLRRIAVGIKTLSSRHFHRGEWGRKYGSLQLQVSSSEYVHVNWEK